VLHLACVSTDLPHHRNAAQSQEHVFLSHLSADLGFTLHWFAGLKSDQHDHNAATQWQQYYDQETADLVFLLYAEDFRSFGYERFVVPTEQV
jgi:hypothetical protein